MRCTGCEFENEPGAQFCEECGSKLVLACPGCGREVRPTAKFCRTCGTALPVPATADPHRASLMTLAPMAQSRPAPRSPEAERRQLTVLFCDLVGSTALSAQLDPEDYRAVVQQYQQTAATVIQRHEGYLAQYLGDGLLVYFGYPTAHEDDARRAVRTGLEIVEALKGQARPQPLPVRIGIHTGLVVIGDIGARGRTEQLALGETPNIAARIQNLAESDTVLISAATQRLIDGQFESQPLGSHLVKGLDTLLAVYHVQSERQGISPLAGKATLTPLVGREQELGVLVDRWEQAKEGRGQVVLLSGEPGIGKSRLAYTLRARVAAEGSLLLEARCSPYHQHSALYPLIEALQRTLLFTRQDTESEKIAKLEQALAWYNLQESLPLFTALLSLPTPAQYPALTLTPQKQKERTLQALLQLFVAQADRQAMVSVWEDVHWADPSSLEFLTLLTEQIPTTKLLLVLTFRPEFTLPWKPHSHISQLVLNRLGRKQVEAMIEKVAADKTLSAEVIEQIRVKTDGVPLFVEELTKAVLEADGVGAQRAVPLQTIPATLQEALLARLDRLSEARPIAQLGATLGREFSHELIQAITSLGAEALHAALEKLVEAEILYQRGIGEQARYYFKHALIQDTAYQSLLKSTRQQYHQQVAQVLEERFPQITETQPELLAHHYTEARLIEQALSYWQQAGQRTIQRSSHVEAIAHLSKGLALLQTLPHTPAHLQRELLLQVTLGTALMVTQGYAAPDVGKAYSRARELCAQVNDTPLRFSVLWNLMAFYAMHGDLQTGREIGEQLIDLSLKVQDPILRTVAAHGIGVPSVLLGEFARAHEFLAQGIRIYYSQQYRSDVTLFGDDLGVSCLCWGAWASFNLGYPEQALNKVEEALTLARKLGHAPSLVFALAAATFVHVGRREEAATQERAEAVLKLCAEQGFARGSAQGAILRGWALALQGQYDEGLEHLRQGLAAYQVTGAELFRPYFLALLAEVYGEGGQTEEGLAVLVKALAQVDKTGECYYEAELYRLKGELLLQQFKVQSSEFKVPNSQHLTPGTHAEAEAEACFRKAIDIARKQQAKYWDLRAVMSLARLWQQQGKTAKAHEMLSALYLWFTEGFDTKDLQEAKAVLDELAGAQ